MTENNTKTNKPQRCSIAYRKLPLDFYRLPESSRKWKYYARQLRATLLEFSTYANGDGTFINDGIDYSPSFKTLTECSDDATLTRHTNDLRTLGFMSWTRERHRAQRRYVLSIPEPALRWLEENFPARTWSITAHVQDSALLTFADNTAHVQDSTAHVRDEHCSRSGVSLLTVGGHPSLSVFNSQKQSVQSNDNGGSDGFTTTKDDFEEPPGKMTATRKAELRKVFGKLSRIWQNYFMHVKCEQPHVRRYPQAVAEAERMSESFTTLQEQDYRLLDEVLREQKTDDILSKWRWFIEEKDTKHEKDWEGCPHPFRVFVNSLPTIAA